MSNLVTLPLGSSLPHVASSFSSLTLPPHTIPSHSAPQAVRPHPPAAQEPLTFRVIQISSFVNHSWAYNQGSGWLGEIQTHSWDSAMGTIRFLKPWSRGNFSQVELKNFQSFFRLYLHGFIQEVQAFVNRFQFECEFFFQG